MICESCGKKHNGLYGSGRFCSKSCSKRRFMSEEQRKNLSDKLRKIPDKYCKCGKLLYRYSNSVMCRSCLYKSRTIGSKYGLSTFDHINYNNQRKRIIRSEYIKREGGKCLRCGYNKYEGALDFHHRDPKEKSFALSVQNFGKRRILLEKEIAKCDLLCSNCYREIHHAELVHLAEREFTKLQVTGS
jgi:5-methylcytosine-specific restriction endonuclease McrA